MRVRVFDGFLIVINKDGRCLYVSDSVSVYLGLAQVDLIGTRIFNFVHPDDHTELQKHLESKCCSETEKFCHKSEDSKADEHSKCSFFIRMKSTLTRRGMNLKSSGYKVVHITGSITDKTLPYKSDGESPSKETDADSKNKFVCFTGTATVLRSPALEMKLDGPVFFARLDLSLRVSHCEDRIKQLANYEADEIEGCTIYQFIHAADVSKIRACHLEILRKGQVTTPYYRWLLKNGSHLWVQSSVALLVDKHQAAAEDSFVWITYVLGHGKDEMSVISLPKKSEIGTDITTSPADNTAAITIKKDNNSQLSPPGLSPQSHSSICNGALAKNIDDSPPNTACSDCSNSPIRLTKQQPGKMPKLKRMYSSNSYDVRDKSDERILMSNMKRERLDSSDDVNTLVCSPAANAESSSTDKAVANDVLDVHSTVWGNPPNREVSNQSDLRTTVIHHHYPFGIDPNLLNSNPVFAKMLTTNYVNYNSVLSQRDAYLLTPPSVNFFAPVLNTVPPLVPSQHDNISCCPTSVATILDELRKDPMRKISPPNKVVLSYTQIPQVGIPQQTGVADNPSSNRSSLSRDHQANSMPPSLLSLSNVASNSIFLAPIAGFGSQGPNGPLILQPFSFPHGTFNSLPI